MSAAETGKKADRRNRCCRTRARRRLLDFQEQEFDEHLLDGLDDARRQFLERLRDGLRSASDGLEKRREVAGDALSECLTEIFRADLEVLYARLRLLRLRLEIVLLPVFSAAPVSASASACSSGSRSLMS